MVRRAQDGVSTRFTSNPALTLGVLRTPGSASEIASGCEKISGSHDALHLLCRAPPPTASRAWLPLHHKQLLQASLGRASPATIPGCRRHPHAPHKQTASATHVRPFLPGERSLRERGRRICVVSHLGALSYFHHKE